MFFRFLAGRAQASDISEAPSRLTEQDLALATPPLRRLARALARDDSAAEDLLQNTLAKAWASQHTYTDQGDGALPWLKTVMRSEHTQAFRNAAQNAVTFTDDEAVLHAVAVSGAQYERCLLGELVALAEPQTVAALNEELAERPAIGGRHRKYIDPDAAKRAKREQTRLANQRYRQRLKSGQN